MALFSWYLYSSAGTWLLIFCQSSCLIQGSIFFFFFFSEGGKVSLHFLKKFYLYVFMHMSVHRMVLEAHEGLEGVWSPGTGVRNGCEATMWVQRTEPQSCTSIWSYSLRHASSPQAVLFPQTLFTFNRNICCSTWVSIYSLQNTVGTPDSHGFN